MFPARYPVVKLTGLGNYSTYQNGLGMVVYTFNVSTQNEETGGSLRFEASLVYIWSSRIEKTK